MSEQLIKSLLNSKIYPHSVNNIKLIETHISWVILTGKYAYKIKKSVNFGFLDFTDLKKRKYFCELELKLNKRLASDLYLKVIPIGGSFDNPELDGKNNVIEYAIVMNEFDQQQLLTNIHLNSQIISDLAQIIADFHQNTAIVSEQKFLNIQTALDPFEQNFTQIAPLLEDKQDLAIINNLQKQVLSEYPQLKNHLQKRIEQQVIKQCHGDLHLGNIIQAAQKPIIFDCIEFNDEFRFIDVISDSAFLMMDLLDKKHSDLANLFISNYLAKTQDYYGLYVLNFYLTHRALVRAKVNLFAKNNDNKQQVIQNYRNYVNLAIDCQKPKTQFIAITYGVSASGKSYSAAQITKHLGAITISSDNLRKLQNCKDYSDSGRNQIYVKLLEQAKLIVNAGFSVVIDATFLAYLQRKQVFALAHELGILMVIIECRADITELKKRCKLRAKLPNCNSDADFNVITKQLNVIEPLLEHEKAHSLISNNNLITNLKTLVLGNN